MSNRNPSLKMTKNRVQSADHTTKPPTGAPREQPQQLPTTAPPPPPPAPTATVTTTNNTTTANFWASNPLRKQQQQQQLPHQNEQQVTSHPFSPPTPPPVVALGGNKQSDGTTTAASSSDPKRPRSPTQQQQQRFSARAKSNNNSHGSSTAPPAAPTAADTTTASDALQIPRVVNIRKSELVPRGYGSFLDWAAGSKHLYIGRSMQQYVPGTVGSKWGNPFPLKKHTLEESLQLYEAHVRGTPALWGALEELAGLDEIGCWCAPAPCHGNVLQRLLAEKLQGKK